MMAPRRVKRIAPDLHLVYTSFTPALHLNEEGSSRLDGAAAGEEDRAGARGEVRAGEGRAGRAVADLAAPLVADLRQATRLT